VASGDRADFKVAIAQGGEQADAVVEVVGGPVNTTGVETGDTVRWDGSQWVDAPFIADEVILTAPNLSEWRLVVANNGALTTEAVV
jgi:hypothetical protein